MQTLAFDGRMGAAGDMLLATLLAVGADRNAMAPVEASDQLSIRYVVDETLKNGIQATTVDVLLEGTAREQQTHDHHDADDAHDDDHGHHDSDADHGHEHHHHHDSDATHGHDHSSPPDHAEGQGPHRSYREVIEIVESLDLPTGVETDAKAVFELLGEAESQVHGTDLDDTHFHEVGADDAIADVVGAALLFDDLGPDRVVTTPVSAGGGEIAMSHGTYPVPAPAVVNLAARASWELQGGPIETELLTPTGAAILAHFAEGVDTLPPLRVEQGGYGAGGYDFQDRPNVLRATLGKGDQSLATEDIRVLETNLDDATPETLGALQETLKTAGARDVSILPTTMKKARPGHLVKVIVRPEDAEQVARRLAVETGTLGVRDAGAQHRWVATRSYETVAIDVDGATHDLTVKVARDQNDNEYDVSTEHDDALAVALETALPVREVRRRAEAAYRER
jgi:uncharacterized protein (TIGR00299 family) protein